MMPPQRVRHHTDDAGLEKIRARGAIMAGRGWGNIAAGVNVEVEPFGTTRPSTPGRPGPKADLGCAGEGAYVEFDAPPQLVATANVGPRNTGLIPLLAGQLFSLHGVNPVYVKVRLHWWQFWRTRAR